MKQNLGMKRTIIDYYGWEDGSRGVHCSVTHRVRVVRKEVRVRVRSRVTV